mgnify:CR=1 FL=1
MHQKLRNCKGCGKLFMSRGVPFCVDCLDKQAEDEKRIIQYVSDNPLCTIIEIVNALGINENIVRRLIEEGRLIQAGIDYKYPCSKCGEPIASGQYCDKCAKKLREEIRDEQRRRAERDPMGLRYRQLSATAREKN